MGKKEKRREKRKEKFAQREACAENQPKEIENECYSNINFIQLFTIQDYSTQNSYQLIAVLDCIGKQFNTTAILNDCCNSLIVWNNCG